jgi:hypothetical protein
MIYNFDGEVTKQFGIQINDFSFRKRSTTQAKTSHHIKYIDIAQHLSPNNKFQKNSVLKNNLFTTRDIISFQKLDKRSPGGS